MVYFGKLQKTTDKENKKIMTNLLNTRKPFEMIGKKIFDKSKNKLVDFCKEHHEDDFVFYSVIKINDNDVSVFQKIIDKFCFSVLNINDEDVENTMSISYCFFCDNQAIWFAKDDAYDTPEGNASKIFVCHKHKPNLDEYIINELKGETYSVTRTEKPDNVIMNGKEIKNINRVSITKLFRKTK